MDVEDRLHRLQELLDEVQASTLAVEYLRNAGIDGVDVSPAYDVSTRQINVSVRAEDREALEGIGPRLAEVAKHLPALSHSVVWYVWQPAAIVPGLPLKHLMPK